MTVVAILDLETTGLHADKKDEVIEYCVNLVDLDNPSDQVQKTRRCKPHCKINPKAQAVHGISMADLEGLDNFSHTDHSAELITILETADVVVCHNTAFDLEFLDKTFKRLKLHWNRGLEFCTMEMGRWATLDGKSPRLEELCFACGIEYDAFEAHAADYDVDKTLECLMYGIKCRAFVLPR